MYQAIVFLPLLGAIIAGFITMVGARLRHPGAEPGAHRQQLLVVQPQGHHLFGRKKHNTI